MAMATRMVSAMAKITTRARVKEKMVQASRDAAFAMFYMLTYSTARSDF